MKFTCEKFALAEALNLASRAVSTKSTIEALEGILIEANVNRIEVTGYDLETGVTSFVEATVNEPGRIVVSARMIMDIVRKLPDDIVLVETNEKLLTTITCGLSQSSMLGISPQEYPALPRVDYHTSLALSYDSMRNLIRRTAFATAVVDNRPILTGVCIEAENDDILGVAIDGYRLGLSKEKLKEAIDKPCKFVIPGRSIKEIEKIITPNDDDIHLDVSNKHLLVRKANVRFVCRLLEGEFINYQSVIPKEFNTVIKVDTASICDSVERASVIISDRLRTPVYMRFSENEIKVDCSSSLGKVHDKTECEIEGQDVEIGVNNRYMLEALRACECEKINIKILTNISPVVIVPREGDDFLFIVVPMRI